MLINRRKFLADSGFNALSKITVQNGLNERNISHDTDIANKYTLFLEKANFDFISEVMKFRKIDAHVHVYWPDFTKIFGWVRGSWETQIFFRKEIEDRKASNIQISERYARIARTISEVQ